MHFSGTFCPILCLVVENETNTRLLFYRAARLAKMQLSYNFAVLVKLYEIKDYLYPILRPIKF